MCLPVIIGAVFGTIVLSPTTATSLERQNVICILAPNEADKSATDGAQGQLSHGQPLSISSHQTSSSAITGLDNDHDLATPRSSATTVPPVKLQSAAIDKMSDRKRRRKTHKKNALSLERRLETSQTTNAPLPTTEQFSAAEMTTLTLARQEESDSSRLEHNILRKSKQSDVTKTVTSNTLEVHSNEPKMHSKQNDKKKWDPVAVSRDRLSKARKAQESSLDQLDGKVTMSTIPRFGNMVVPSTTELSKKIVSDELVRGNDQLLWRSNADSSFVETRDRFNREFAVESAAKDKNANSAAMPKKTTASHAVPGAILVSTEHDPTQDFAQRFNITWSEQNDKNHQGNVWEELEKLRGKAALSAGEIQEILARSVPGVDYPTYTWIPNTKFSCNNVNQPGFYADPEARCQVIRRCDYNGNKWNYLCPNATLFNQITLVCDWYFNIDCSKAVQYYDYSNSRLYHSDWVLLDSVAEASLAG